METQADRVSANRLAQRFERARAMLNRFGEGVGRYYLPALMDGERAVLAQIRSSDGETWYPVGISIKDGELVGTQCSCRDFMDTARAWPATYRDQRVCKHVAVLMLEVKRRGLMPQAQAGVGEPLVREGEASDAPSPSESKAPDIAVPASSPAAPHQYTDTVADILGVAQRAS